MAVAIRWRGFGAAVSAGVCLAMLAGVGYSLWGGRSEAGVVTTPEFTASLPMRTGETGLPLPRFVSLKADKVNVRRGPSSDHRVEWVFTRKGLPVEIVAEFDNWRRIRDSEGAEGWVYHSLLSGRRSALVAPWSGAKAVALHKSRAEQSSLVALLDAGVMANVESCTGTWCQVSTRGYSGWVEQAMLWGVYPGERVE